MATVCIPVIPGGSVTGDKGRAIPRVVGEIDFGALDGQFTVPVRDYDADRGYQRPASDKRVRDLSTDLEKGRVDLPTALLLNLRDFDPSCHLRTEGGVTTLWINEVDRFYVVDGQHRLSALKRLLEEAGNEAAKRDRWTSFKVPFVCLLGASEGEEMRQFYVVNSTAKSVSTDLAYDLLRTQAQQSPEIREAITERGDDWKLQGQELADRLNVEAPWAGRIRFPNQKKTKQMTIPSSGMVNSLRELVRGSSPIFEQAGLDDRVSILVAFWSGILRVLPEANETPDQFTLQKMTGAVVLHSILPGVIEIIRSQGASILDPEAYREVMEEPLLRLEGETRDEIPVSGVNFWRSGADGAAGAFSSNAGRRVLRARLKNSLPSVTIR